MGIIFLIEDTENLNKYSLLLFIKFDLNDFF